MAMAVMKKRLEVCEAERAEEVKEQALLVEGRKVRVGMRREVERSERDRKRSNLLDGEQMREQRLKATMTNKLARVETAESVIEMAVEHLWKLRKVVILQGTKKFLFLLRSAGQHFCFLCFLSLCPNQGSFLVNLIKVGPVFLSAATNKIIPFSKIITAVYLYPSFLPIWSKVF